MSMGGWPVPNPPKSLTMQARPQADVICLACNGSGKQPEPTMADVIALLERQAQTCERIAKTLGEIAETVKGL